MYSEPILLVVGDIHIKNKTLGRSETILKEINKAIAKHLPDAVILLGDVFDSHHVAHAECMRLYTEFLKNAGVPVYHVIGNHEMVSSVSYLPKSNLLHPFTLSGRPLHFIDKPKVVTLGDIKIGFIPYTPPGYFNQALSELTEKPRLIFAHQEFKGADYGHVSENGDVYEGTVEIISGHIHKAQKLGKVWYPGTPAQETFAEDEDKAIYLIQAKEYGYDILERIELNVPKLKTITTNTQDLPTDLQKGTEYRIVIEDTAENIFAFKKTQEYKKLSKKVKLQLKPISQVQERARDRKAVEFKVLLKTYAQKEGLEDLFSEIMEEVQ